ncbi:MAG: peptidase M14 carboxypeptidase A [Parcubacteria group bacterium Gr01-1014_20]|nr:MAG: peptidase M14 carboxypeptidase A [Parcubacteria group bacterium Gr01-1014_20]
MTKKLIIGAVIVVLVGVGAYFLFRNSSKDVVIIPGDESGATGTDQPPTGGTPGVVDKTKTVIGQSAGGRDILAYHYGEGAKEILFVGGIHGGYEWNTALVAYEMMDFLKMNPTAIASGTKVTVIPVLNPDGLAKVVSSTGKFAKADVNTSQTVQVSGRFNGNNVDLNRNFDCDWQTKAVWQDKTVSGGSAAFSEPEAQAIKTYVETKRPVAAVVWNSSANGVFASNCHAGVLPETLTIANVYGKASGYKVYKEFNFYEITGDMVNWLAKQGIPAISVLLATHEDTDWTKNEAGIKALLSHYAK